MRKNRTIRSFTLIELVVAMGVFSIMMLGLVQLFSSTQNLWSGMSSRTETFENARIVMDLIANDLQTIYYDGTAGKTFFTTNSDYSQISFGTIRSSKANSHCNSKITKVTYKYQGVGDGTGDDKLKSEFSVRAASVGDHDSGGAADSNWKMTELNPFTTGSEGSFATVIRGVYSLKMIPLKSDMQEDSRFQGGSLTGAVPAAVRIELTLLDNDTITRWKNINSTDPGSPASSAFPSSGDVYENVIRPALKKFTRIVVIGR